MGGLNKIDYTPMTVFRKRMHSHANEQYIGTTKVFKVAFDPDFDVFCAHVAYALRLLIVYRTDGGRFARGLVRANGDLQATHGEFLAVPVLKGTQIRLLARLYRRENHVATNRWVLSIEFARPKEDFLHMEDAPIVASMQVTDLSRKAIMEHLLHDLTLLYSDQHKFPGHRGRHMRAMIAIADRVGYPQNWDLWYYTSPLVFDYIKFETGDEARKRMTAPTNGKFPFDGESGWDALNRTWRIYPFRDAVRQCYGLDRDHCRNRAGNILQQVEIQMGMTYRDIRQQKARLSGVPTWTPGMWAGSSLVGAFFNHIDALGNDPNSLYFAW